MLDVHQATSKTSSHTITITRYQPSQVDSTLDRKAPTLLKPGIVVDLVTVQHINKSAWCRFIACPRNHQVLTSRAHRPAERWIVKSLEVGSSDVAASLAYGGALRLETLASGS